MNADINIKSLINSNNYYGLIKEKNRILDYIDLLRINISNNLEDLELVEKLNKDIEDNLVIVEYIKTAKLKLLNLKSE